MNAEAEQLQVRPLTAVLPVRLKMLDTAGGVLPLSRPTTSTQGQTAASAADGAAESAQQVWIRFWRRHCEVVYPAEGFEDHHDGPV